MHLCLRRTPPLPPCVGFCAACTCTSHACVCACVRAPTCHMHACVLECARPRVTCMPCRGTFLSPVAGWGGQEPRLESQERACRGLVTRGRRAALPVPEPRGYHLPTASTHLHMLRVRLSCVFVRNRVALTSRLASHSGRLLALATLLDSRLALDAFA